MRQLHRFTQQLAMVTGLVLLLAGLLFSPRPAAAEGWLDVPDLPLPDWWTERFEVHGFVTTKLYGRSPGLDFAEEFEMSSWRTELNLEMEFDVYENEDLRIGLYSVVRPIYEAIYDLNPDRWGSNARGGNFGTAPAYPLHDPIAHASGNGDKFPGDGSGINGEYRLTNSDTGQIFLTSFSGCAPVLIGVSTLGAPIRACTSNNGQVPSLTIDNVVFFGRVTAPWLPISREQDKIGGNATGVTYRDYLESPWRVAASAGTFGAPTAVAATNALEASLALMATNPIATGPGGLALPLNFYSKGGRGDRSSIDRGFADINQREWNLKFDCFDNAHPWCFVREFYTEIEYKNTFIRLGRQQIVWGKTDAFRLQDIVNPIDAGYHNVFPDLEERRIPQLALDVIHSFGNVGPLQDVSLEFAWVFDRFIGTQFGQCGEPYTFTAACESRADAGGHSLFNFSLANVDEVHWKFKNTEPGLRLEFRIPKPSIAFSFSAFWGHQDLPVAESSNLASVDNPNCASMLFLQGFGFGPTIEVLDTLAGGVGGGPGTTPWSTGIDCYDRAAPSGLPNAAGSLDVANQVLQSAWAAVTAGCIGLTDPDDLRGCVFGTPGGDPATLAALALPWSASEATLRYPRVLTLGMSLDYQFPGIDTILRLEMASDLDRKINNTAKSDWVDESPVFLAAIGLDRPTYIPFLNKNRTAFLSFQTFVEHVIDYDDGTGRGDGMVVPETQIISTIFMQNYWRNDSLILTSFAAYDYQGDAFIMGPSFRWVVNSSFFIDVGVNFLLGDQDDEHNLTDLCSNHTLQCITDPTTWNPGNWQVLNSFRRTAQSPWWGKQSFADKIMEDRDEVWIGFTYQF